MHQAEKTAPQALLAIMTGYFALTGHVVSDAGLGRFPAETADDGVQAIRMVQSAGRERLAQHAWRNGKTVNVAAALPGTGLALTPAVFRSLHAETRKPFKKRTPPISYIEAGDRRPS